MKILYKIPDGNLAILTPSQECLLEHSIHAIALKDVPEGLPFWIVENSEIPTDRTFRNAWELPEDYREPDGYGSEYNTFKEIEDASN